MTPQDPLRREPYAGWADDGQSRPLPPAQPQGWVDPPRSGLLDDGYLDEADDMCPNCVTPWKCNGPHLADETPYMQRLLAANRRGCMWWLPVLVLILALSGVPGVVAGEPEPTSDIGTVLIGGTLSYVGAKYGPSYLALPEPRGTVATICGPADCVTRRSTDYGPDQRVHPDRIADLSAADFVRVCGVPLSAGLCRGTVELEPPVSPDDDRLRVEDGGPLPQTDTLTP